MIGEDICVYGLYIYLYIYVYFFIYIKVERIIFFLEIYKDIEKKFV